MQFNRRSKDDYLNVYANKLLAKASNIHMKPSEFQAPARRKSLIDSYVHSLNNETDQGTDRIKKSIIEKNRSCSNLQDYQDEYNGSPQQLQSSQQFTIMNQNSKLMMHKIEKKLKNFKFAKENNHNSCTSTVAKMKCFCLDNQCFDFYRCTDLLLLKYLIYVLLQEINSKNENSSSFQDQILPSQKNEIKDTIAAMQNTVDVLKNQKLFDKNNGNPIEDLSRQIKKIQNSIGSQQISSSNYDVFTTPQSSIKQREFVFQSSSATQKREQQYQNSPSISSQKIIQFQIDELQMKNEAITKLTSKNNDLELELKMVNNQLTEALMNLSISQKQLSNKDQELKGLIRKTEKLLETTSIAVKEKDQLQDYYKSVRNDHEQLKTKFDDLQKSNQSVLNECTILKKSLNDSVESSQQKIKNEEQKLQQDLIQKNKQIRQLSEDGKILGQYLKDISSKIQQVPSDQIPQNLQILQRELQQKESFINSKLNNMHLAQIDLAKSNNANNKDKKSRKFMSSHNQLIDQLQSFQVNSDMIAMMIVQSEVIEKFIN
ncbi:unnamed protein product (macronuclear) [Paramecium tetraurelia]|uniref:Uncharacterized protein n=1 Tax=Paramecium tetraurelia TaxID=5888 RepID=A0BMB6_PARTE|nr:uncharacterized protein GSPATT00030319001 [Paramecium tetraurelia]CAK59683.1 unnamed protein product [Paramecium tetraurelia]|eukprot:XP_001427081.1 hypothetical protein (macronuclear) [Paramecium tetraurelia strain d4-2]